MTKFSAQQQSQLAQIGVFLRENREKQGKSLEDIAIHTYIRPQLLGGIESGDPDLLPEPVFVQGFIRRYAETLGLNGRDLSQQFAVDSIPSTPRPIREAAPGDSPTTRLTRVSNGTAAVNNAAINEPEPSGIGSRPTDSQTAATDSIFSAGSAAPLEDSLVGQSESATEQKQMPAEAPLIIDDAVLNLQSVDALSKSSDSESSDSESSDFEGLEPEGLEPESLDSKSLNSETIDSGSLNSRNLESRNLEPAVSETTLTYSDTDSATEVRSPDFQQELDRIAASDASAFPGSLSAVDPEPLPTADLPTTDLPDPADIFGSKVAEFDRQNLDSAPATAVSNSSFDDGLPNAFTTAADTPAPAPVASPPVTRAASPYADAEPVGVEYGDLEGPNLKPFIIGGVVAALLVAAIAALASLFGGNRPPAVADNPAVVEQTTEAGSDLEAQTPPPDPAPVTPPVSTAPVYVEAKATAEAWVSVIADGNTLFEGTLQPGDTAVWEGQNTISVYSGDAGALQVGQNGEDVATMGDRGQPEEKIFTLN